RPSLKAKGVRGREQGPEARRPTRATEGPCSRPRTPRTERRREEPERRKLLDLDLVAHVDFANRLDDLHLRRIRASREDEARPEELAGVLAVPVAGAMTGHPGG